VQHQNKTWCKCLQSCSSQPNTVPTLPCEIPKS